MNTDTLLLIAYVTGALCFSFACSIAEAVLLSVTPSYIEGLKNKKPGRAALLKRLKQDYLDRSLAAILTLNTIAHTVGAIMAGAKAAVVFGDTWFGVFSAVMTLLILLLSEIVPKTIGAVYWPKLTGITAHFVHLLIVTLFPIVWISEKLTQVISGKGGVHHASRDELIAMATLGQQSGFIDENEYRIIQSLLRFNTMTVTDVMTPRTVISALPEDMKVKDAIDFIQKHPFSRIPLYQTNLDDISGFVLRYEILLNMSLDRHDKPLKSFMREILVVHQKTPAATLLKRLIKERQHIVVIIDEHGGTSGIVTLEDLIETLIGMEIMDEIEKIEDMRLLARKLWQDRAKALGIEDIPGHSGEPNS